MPEGASKVIRTLHLKFTLPGADPAQLSAMMKSAKPFWEFFGTMQMRLLQNVDDPARFIHEIEYDTHEVIELNRQRVASDPQVQAYLRTWRSFFPGSVEIDVYQEAV